MRTINEYITKNILYPEHSCVDVVDCTKDDINREIRKELNKVLNTPPTSRDKEIESIIAEEKKEMGN